METVVCNLCGSPDNELVYEMPDQHWPTEVRFNVVECRRCGLGYVSPRPTRTEIDAYYPQAFFDEFVEHGDAHRRRYEEEAAIVTSLAPTGRRLLDVGCANGDFPRLMASRGWAVEGVEIASSAREIDDFPVYRSEFPLADAPAESYDVVTAWAVLEHVHDPMAYFHKAAEVLKPGGVFVFLVTNFESVSSRSLFLEDPPRHLYFFTEPCVDEYLRRTGLWREWTEYSDRVYAITPTNWLRYYVGHYLRRRRFTWEDAQFSLKSHFSASGHKPSLLDSAAFVARHPLLLFDRVLAPAYARAQIRRRTYAIVTYGARKR